MTPERLAEIETRANAATKAPWVAVRDREAGRADEWRDVWGPDHERVIGPEQLRDTARIIRNAENNAEFIAHARTDVPELCAALREQRAMIAELQACINALSAPDSPMVSREESTTDLSVKIVLRPDGRAAAHAIAMVHPLPWSVDGRDLIDAAGRVVLTVEKWCSREVREVVLQLGAVAVQATTRKP